MRAFRLLLLTTTILLLFTFPAWFPAIGTFLVVSDPLQKADALAVLAGDENSRLAYATQLFNQGYADWFVITDMDLSPTHPAGRYAKRIQRKAMDLGVPEQRILIAPGSANTTFEEAQLLEAIVDRKGFLSLIVVTSPYHTRRARWILRQVFAGKDVQISVQPIPRDSYQANNWWKTGQGRWQTALEYAKILSQLLGYHHLEDFPPLIRDHVESYRDHVIREQNN